MHFFRYVQMFGSGHVMSFYSSPCQVVIYIYIYIYIYLIYFEIAYNLFQYTLK